MFKVQQVWSKVQLRFDRERSSVFFNKINFLKIKKSRSRPEPPATRARQAKRPRSHGQRPQSRALIPTIEGSPKPPRPHDPTAIGGGAWRPHDHRVAIASPDCSPEAQAAVPEPTPFQARAGKRLSRPRRRDPTLVPRPQANM
jgi:hypothetical protein